MVFSGGIYTYSIYYILEPLFRYNRNLLSRMVFSGGIYIYLLYSIYYYNPNLQYSRDLLLRLRSQVESTYLSSTIVIICCNCNFWWDLHISIIYYIIEILLRS